MMSRGVCSRSQGHSTRSTSTTRLSDTSSWPSRASSKAAPGGTVTNAGVAGTAAPEGSAARAEPAVRRRSSRARRGPCGPASATTTSPAAPRPARSSRPSSSPGSISKRRPPPGSASSATRSRSSPSSPAGTKTAPPPASARSEAAGARPAAAPMYTSVRRTALPRGPCERAPSARRRRGRARGSRRAAGARGSGERLGVEAGRVLDVGLLLAVGEPGLPGLRLPLSLERLLDHRLGLGVRLRRAGGLLGDLDDVLPELRLDRRRDRALRDTEGDRIELVHQAARGEAAQIAALVLRAGVEGVLLGDLQPVGSTGIGDQQLLHLQGLGLGAHQHVARRD